MENIIEDYTARILKDKKESEDHFKERQEGPDGWLHKFDKDTWERTRFIRVIKRHPCQVRKDDEFYAQLISINLEGKEQGYIFLCDFPNDFYNGIMDNLKSFGLPVKLLDLTSATKLDRLWNIDFIKEIVGTGGLCLSGCFHRLVFIGIDDKEYDIKWVPGYLIRQFFKTHNITPTNKHFDPNINTDGDELSDDSE